MRWEDLLQTAVLGTQHAPPIDVACVSAERHLPPMPGAEEAVLAAAAHQAILSRAGYVAPVLQGTRPTPCPPETAKTLPVAAVILLRQFYEGEARTRLLPEMLAAIQARGYVVPPTEIPALAEAARMAKAIRPSAIAVMGHRGQWMAAQNPDWAFLRTDLPLDTPPTDTEIWERGTLEARAEVLTRTWHTHPTLAREWLQGVWKQENAAARRTLLATLEKPNPDDEAFLADVVAKDKSKEVKALAAERLAAVPGSALARRMEARVAGCIRLKGNRLLGFSLEVTVPGSIPTDWAEDGVVDSKEFVDAGVGALYQCLSQTSPRFLAAHFGRSPADFLKLLHKTPNGPTWAAAVLWATALHSDAEWTSVCVQQYWANPLSDAKTDQRVNGAIRKLHALVGQPAFFTLYKDFEGKLSVVRWSELVFALPYTEITTPLGKALVETANRWLTSTLYSQQQDHVWYTLADGLAPRLEPSGLETVLGFLRTVLVSPQSHYSNPGRLFKTLETRAEIYRTLAAL